MAFIRRLRNQNWLFPPTIADLVEEDHICRLVDDVVESIDFKSIEEKYDGPGSPAYHSKVMMKLLIQGTIDGICSSRKISKATKENVVYMYLSDHLNPDFRTICGFMKDNLETIKLVIVEIAKLAREMGMVNLKRIWAIKSQTEAIGVNSTKNGRIDQASLRNMCRSIKGIWSQILSSLSKGLSIYPL